MAATERAKSRKENTMPTNDEKPNIYPPSIIDPLLPGGIPSTPDGTEKPAPDPDAVARDRYLGELAREGERLEAVFGEAPPLTPEEARAIVDAAAGGPPFPDLPPDDMLREIFKGQMNPALPVAGARVEYCARPGNWRDAVALRVADVDQADGNVLLDLEWGDRNAVTAVRYGEGVRCWRFRAE
jgi:hypothetical protein